MLSSLSCRDRSPALLDLIAGRRSELLERSLPKELPPLLGIPRGLLKKSWGETDKAGRIVIGIEKGETKSLDFLMSVCRPSPRPRRRGVVTGAVEGPVSLVVRNVRNRLGIMEERGARNLLHDQTAEGMGVYRAWLTQALLKRKEMRDGRVSQLMLQLQADRNIFDALSDVRTAVR